MVLRVPPTACGALLVVATLLSCTARADAQAAGQPPQPLLPGHVLWTVQLGRPAAAGAATDDTRIYVPLQPEQLVAVARTDGRLLWERDIESASPPVRVGNLLVVTASDEVHALDPATGDEQWRLPFEHDPGTAVCAAGASLVGIVRPGVLLALDPTNGSTRWQRPLDSQAPARLTADAQRILVAHDDGRVVAYATGDGRTLWTQQLEAPASILTMTATRAVTAAGRNQVWSLALDDGRPAWHWRIGARPVAAAADAGLVFLLSRDNLLRAVNEGNGNQRWKKDSAGRPSGPPVVAGPTLVVAGLSAQVGSYAAATGAALGTYTAPEDVLGSPLVAYPFPATGPAVILVTRDGRVIAIRPGTAPPGGPVPEAPAPSRPVG